MRISTPSNLKYSEESFTKRVDDAASSYSRRSALTPIAVIPDKSVARWLYGKGQSLRFGAQTQSCRPIKKRKRRTKRESMPGSTFCLRCVTWFPLLCKHSCPLAARPGFANNPRAQLLSRSLSAGVDVAAARTVAAAVR